VVVADVQTAGRGRRGAAWFGAPGESLMFSILWRPDEPKPLWPRLALAMGLAVANACERFVPITGLKWPNDVWIRGRKVAGILVEAGEDFVVAGVGINVNTHRFPDGIATQATSLACEAGFQPERAAVLASVLERFSNHAGRIGRGFDEIVAAARQRCVLAGGAVVLRTQTGELLRGQCDGIGPAGELRVRHGERVLEILQADDVRPVPNG